MLVYKKLSTALLGNPIFENKNNYTQNKVIPLKEYIANHSLQKNKVIVDRYIKLTHQLWSYGIHDLIFNFTLNNGVAKNGSVIQLDFGECDFKKSKLRSHILRKVWLAQKSYKSLKSDPLQPYIAKSFAEEFTLKKMNQFWKSGL